MKIAEIIPVKNFQNRGVSYKEGAVFYVEEATAQRWERDGYAKIVGTYDVAAIIAAHKKKGKSEKEADA